MIVIQSRKCTIWPGSGVPDKSYYFPYLCFLLSLNQISALEYDNNKESRLNDEKMQQISKDAKQ